MEKFYTQKEIFKDAIWVCACENAPLFPILRKKFWCKDVKKAELYVIGLGFFHCFINGQEVTDQMFLPLSTDFEERKNYPIDEKVTGHRTYVPKFDVTELLKNGDNVLALQFGGGWYTYEGGKFGDAKAIYYLYIETENGEYEIFSSENDKIGASFVNGYHFTYEELQDYSDFDDACLTVGYDDSGWKNAAAAKPLDTRYQFCDCPADTAAETLSVTVSAQENDSKTYDCGKNISGIPVLRLHAAKGETVEVQFAESANPDGTLNMTYHHGQHFTVVSDGTERIVMPRFTWFGFRYFRVKGNAEPVEVRFIHSAVPVTSSFASDNETLNWLYQAYLNTQLSNMHGGIPSDCPHLERRGYTGDGQLTCHAVMTLTGAKEFYHKWIADISDCQDIYSGHVQYTAPYLRSGGGPGAWGCAIIEVPYRYYKHYGDTEPLNRLYAQMLRYFDYLEAHSENLLVSSDKAGEWCLGDWCAPIQVILPAPFVNNYYYIRSLNRMVEIARLVGREADIPMFEKRLAERKAAVTAAYFNTWDGNFIGCMQGANAFAVDIGLGDKRTYDNLVKYYKQLGRFDTGICGTDIVAKVLFEHGDGELAASLMTSQLNISFEGMRRAGSTTLWENWPDATWDRSQNHPMFGAVAAYLFDYLLGIRQEEGKAGFDDIIIEPVLLSTISRISGTRTLPNGAVSVLYKCKDGNARVQISVPANIKAIFRYHGSEIVLKAGDNSFTVKM